ncbi:hypothetical protein [Exiguobacterium sp. s133]|uniref:hypothetical protein n=1 Tax=Exiguobacterium sp. s133 TaxID=2751213 RepID=UPI001BE9EF94|nr:hypothetical protein [Exiguobacterium sp. s133]
MTIDREEHTPDIRSQITARAILRTIRSSNPSGALSLEHITEHMPLFKGYFEALKKFQEEHGVQYIQVLLEEIYRHGLMEPDRIDSLADALDDHDGVKLYLSYASDAAEKSFSKRAKAMLAIYSGRVIGDPGLLSKSESAVMLEILSSVNDFDLMSFERLFKYIFEYQDFQPDSHNTYYRIADKYGVPASQHEEGLLSFDSSLRKLINVQAINIVTGNSGTGSRLLVKLSPYSQKLGELCAEYEEFYNRTQEEPSE